MQKFRPLKLVLVALIALTAAGTVGFHYIEHWGWFDSFYMVVITLSTVGYQEVHPLSRAGRIFNSFLIFFGVSAMFLAVGAMTHFGSMDRGLPSFRASGCVGMGEYAQFPGFVAPAKVTVPFTKYGSENAPGAGGVC